MSFASAKLAFKSRNSFSILSKVWLDKSFSNNVIRGQYRGQAMSYATYQLILFLLLLMFHSLNRLSHLFHDDRHYVGHVYAHLSHG